MNPRGMRVAELGATATFTVVRVALGVLWLREGLFKYRAGFGRADILLVADGAGSNSRVPDYFKSFAGLLRELSTVFGVAIPLLETLLGLALITGLLTLTAALGSALNLMTYWASDQLIAQYPVMGALSVLVIAWPALAARFSATALIFRQARSKPSVARLATSSLGRWL